MADTIVPARDGRIGSRRVLSPYFKTQDRSPSARDPRRPKLKVLAPTYRASATRNPYRKSQSRKSGSLLRPAVAGTRQAHRSSQTEMGPPASAQPNPSRSERHLARRFARRQSKALPPSGSRKRIRTLLPTQALGFPLAADILPASRRELGISNDEAINRRVLQRSATEGQQPVANAIPCSSPSARTCNFFRRRTGPTIRSVRFLPRRRWPGESFS